MAALLVGCEPPPENVHVEPPGPCGPVVEWSVLPDEVGETSGVAASRQFEGVYWTHNDSGGEPVVFAIDSAGTVLARVRVSAAGNRDWEDIATGPCEPGDERECLFVGDIGDNSEARERVVILRIPEPDPARDSVSRPAERIQVAYPDGPRDAEAVFVTGRGIHIISKGRSAAIDLFRVPPPYPVGREADPAEEAAIMERVQRLGPPPTSLSAQVTAAAARDSVIVVRSYGGLRFFTMGADTLRQLGPPADLSGAAQLQGEGVDFIGDDRLILTGEAGGRSPASLAAVRCRPR